MLCQLCGKRQATIHIEQLIGCAKTTFNICGECAETNQLSGDHESGLKLATLAYKLAMEKAGQLGAEDAPERQDAQDDRDPCPRCGTTLQEFRQTGRLGCERCCEVFRDLLVPMLDHLHRGTTHCGDTPPAAESGDTDEPAADDGRYQQAIACLEQELARAVQAENYEHAAELRDRLERLMVLSGAARP